MGPKNLQELLDSTGNPVDLLRNSQLGAYVYPVVPAEFSNWRREQRAWRDTAVLFDQSHHMVNLFIVGRDALRLIAETGVNSVARFPVEMAKQLVAVTPAGHVIAVSILFREAEDRFVSVGRCSPGTARTSVTRSRSPRWTRMSRWAPRSASCGVSRRWEPQGHRHPARGDRRPAPRSAPFPTLRSRASSTSRMAHRERSRHRVDRSAAG